MRTEAQRKAKEAYTRAHRDITGLLGLLRIEVREHARYAKEDGGPHWAHVGKLAHLTELLVQALASLAQQDEEDIKAALDDAAAGREQAERKGTH